jgi:hypothetical protein
VLAKKMVFICRQTVAPMGLVSIQLIDLNQKDQAMDF